MKGKLWTIVFEKKLENDSIEATYLFFENTVTEGVEAALNEMAKKRRKLLSKSNISFKRFSKPAQDIWRIGSMDGTHSTAVEYISRDTLVFLAQQLQMGKQM